MPVSTSTPATEASSTTDGEDFHDWRTAPRHTVPHEPRFHTPVRRHTTTLPRQASSRNVPGCPASAIGL